MREKSEILICIKKLVCEKGFIYALCMILMDDFRVNMDELHKEDNWSKLNVKEVSLLIGFLIQHEIDFSYPDSPMHVIELKKRTHDLMQELHMSFNLKPSNKLKILQDKVDKGEAISNDLEDRKDLFVKDGGIVEPIFYSGDGVFDTQYLDFLNRKYKYDREWLLKNKNFEIDSTIRIVKKVKEILQKKRSVVKYFGLREQIPQIKKDIKAKYKRIKKSSIDKMTDEVIIYMEFYQYRDLFPEITDKVRSKENVEKDWYSFYDQLLELHVIYKADLQIESSDNFFDNFSLTYEENTNSKFKDVGDYNLYNAKPIIKIKPEKYFVPLPFVLFESVYESPFYWMMEDKKYKDQLALNRGRTGEEVTYEFLSQVFGQEHTYKGVKIRTKKGFDDTDVDILCILGNKALCVQVKSKKLTQLARTGNYEQLQKDFQGAIQDAYNQGLVSRQKILDKNSRFYIDEIEIKLPESIDEVYIMGITTENYPSLTHQAYIMLDKQEKDPYPIFLTIFDLELLVH